MRKVFVCLIAVGALAVAPGPAAAGTVKLSGTHSAAEIEATCKRVGGQWSGPDKNGGAYACSTKKGTVGCGPAGNCYGVCPSCGGKKAASGKGGMGGILTNAPTVKAQPLTPQKVTRVPATAPTQPRSMQPLTASSRLRPGAR